MQRSLTHTLRTLGVLAVLSAPAHAQRLSAPRTLAFGTPPQATQEEEKQGRSLRLAVPRALAPVAPRPRARRHVLWGAALGAGLSAAGWALSTSSDDCDCRFADGWPLIAGSTAVGAGSGYLVYRLRFR